jgi:hypothetical protein
MQIKVQCICETRYSFDVEPINSRMPVRVNCPNCGADGTESANAAIQQELGKSLEQRPKMRVGTQSAPDLRPPGPVSEAAPASAAGAAQEFCAKHRQEPATARCFACEKPICPKCLEQFGYLCSVYCQNQAIQLCLQVPPYAGRKIVVQQKGRRKEKRVLAGAAIALLLSFGGWLWYSFVGSRPSALFSIQIPKSAASLSAAELVSFDELLLLKDNRLTLYDAGSGKEKWSTALTGGRPAARPKPDDLAMFDDEEPPGAHLQISGGDVWVSLADRLAGVDRQTGKLKTEVPINNTIRQVTFTDASLLVLAEDEMKRRFVTHITLPAGKPRTEEVTDAAPFKPVKGKPAASRTPRPRFLNSDDDPASADFAGLESFNKEFLPAGANVIQLKTKLLEKRMVAYEAMKKPGESTLNKPGLSARDSMKAAGELLNEMQRERTGGMALENESRYQVTLRRFAPADAPDWTGEVNGPPMIFPQNTVDVLVAGKSITVFNKKNAKLWDAKLTYPVADSMGSDFPESDAAAPCLEEGGTLYFFDKGVLTAFDLRSGTARWRVTSVGISRIARDSSGMLYVAATSASPDSIQYSQQIRITDKDYPVLLKIDPASGKVLWRAERIGDQCYASGKFVYATRAQISGLDIMNGTMNSADAPFHFRIYRINPSDGALLWEVYRQKAPRHVRVQKSHVLLQFADEVQLIGF